MDPGRRILGYSQSGILPTISLPVEVVDSVRHDVEHIKYFLLFVFRERNIIKCCEF